MSDRGGDHPAATRGDGLQLAGLEGVEHLQHARVDALDRAHHRLERMVGLDRHHRERDADEVAHAFRDVTTRLKRIRL